jgi:hypothetical protein
VANTAAGTPTAVQTPGDCRRRVCDGAGGETDQIDDGDFPDDGNECTSNVCSGGVPAFPAQPIGTSCTQSGGAICDGLGHCVQCLTGQDCPGVDSECRVRTCTGNVCGLQFAVSGTPLRTQRSGDCRLDVCDGRGGVTTTVDDADLPDDGNQCTDNVCTAGVASHPPRPLGTDCNRFPGIICDGNGSCVPQARNGAPCTQPVQCSSGHCVDGYCCNSVCTASCYACDVPGLEGSCNIAAGSACNEQGGSICNSFGGCVPA